jgi:hypothetical protein
MPGDGGIEEIVMSNYFERSGIWERPVTKVSSYIRGWMFIVSFSLQVDARSPSASHKLALLFFR